MCKDKHKFYICYNCIDIMLTIILGIKRLFTLPTIDSRQGFLGLISNGGWILPMTAVATVGRFQNEIMAVVNDALSK